MATGQRSVADLMREHPEGPGTTLRLGPLLFHMNPQSYDETSERAVVTVQTVGGYGRYDYGNKPTRYQISGSTGLAGVYGPGGVQDLRQFQPQAGRPDTLWPFQFPGEFRGVRYVKVTQFKLSRSSASQYFHDFTLEVEEYPKSLLASAVKVPGTVIGAALPVGG